MGLRDLKGKASGVFNAVAAVAVPVAVAGLALGAVRSTQDNKNKKDKKNNGPQ